MCNDNSQRNGEAAGAHATPTSSVLPGPELQKVIDAVPVGTSWESEHVEMATTAGTPRTLSECPGGVPAIRVLSRPDGPSSTPPRLLGSRSGFRFRASTARNARTTIRGLQ
ncbi:hypothetical protein EEB14_20880 [Rhodococcus sp. WS4]|nr:hypothetical protein EEB14_20880 [Rhodococcus sp. WS4]